ncbi:MAG: hypothetical protein PF904_12920 [Kiritimatiellae bacterium]|jgi:hypothetical protein|nr:hypothetical protein [Kiritimatiellia bacterium]
MKKVGVLIFILSLVCLCRSETLLDLDFSEAGEIKKYVVQKERVKGELPQGWIDDSGFAQVWAEYSFGDEQGTRFQRTSVTKIDDNWAQLAVFPLADVSGSRLYRLSLTCRNGSGSDISIGLRQRGKPYKFYWQKNTKFSQNWGTYDWEFRLPGNDMPMGLWIIFRNTGSFDIAKFKLERFSEAALIQELKVKYPQGGPDNLAYSTRFPLGLPTGWSVNRASSDGDVVTVEAAKGDLAPAMRISSAEDTSIYSAPVELVYPIVPHTASLSVRGKGDWTISVFGPGLRQQSKSFKAGDEWQRVELPFKSSIKNSFCQITLSGKGELLIDKLHIGPESVYQGRYIAPSQCEVAVALAPGYDAGAARVVFDDESAAVDTALTGDYKDSVVKWRLFDTNEKELSHGEFKAVKRIKLKDLTERYGSFRLEARVERNGKALSPWAELVWHQLHRPRYWGKDAPDSPFGVHTLSSSRHILMAKAIGINWTRLHDAGLEYIGWWNLEPEKGNWRFFDREIKRYRKHGIKIFAELGTAPPWASYYQDAGLKTFGYFDKFFQPKNLDEYVNYVRVVCERYKGIIDAFDVWNEPWIHAWWGIGYDHTKSGRAGYVTSKNAPADFAQLTKLARDTVHEIQPKALVLGVNTTTSSKNSSSSYGGTEWTRGIVEAGGLDHCDGIAYHCYTTGGVGYPGDSVEKGLSNAISPVREKYGSISKRIWMTEGSPLIYRMGNGLYKHTLPFENRDEVLESADRIVRYQLSMLANGVSRIFLYSMHAHNGHFSTESKKWNVFTTDDGCLHPAGAAHAQFAWMLEDTRFVERRDISSGVYAYIFEGKKRAVAVISSSPGFVPCKMPVDKEIHAFGLFGNELPPGSLFQGEVIYLEADSQAVLLP